MTNSKKLCFAAAGSIVLLLLAGFISADKENDFILVRTMESPSFANLAKVMIISKSDGTSERITLKNIEVGASTAEENLNVEVAKIKEIIDSGYELKDFSGGGGANGVVYTYVFVKK